MEKVVTQELERRHLSVIDTGGQVGSGSNGRTEGTGKGRQMIERGRVVKGIKG